MNGMLKRKTPLKSKTKLGVKKKSNKLLDIVKGNDPAIIDKLKEKGLVKKASTLTKKRKSTGEKEVFRRIWEERPHNCLTCGVHINEARAINFSHLLPKGKYPELRLDPRNVVLQCGQCHMKWHNYGNEMREVKKWRSFFAKYDDLWEEIYNLK